MNTRKVVMPLHKEIEAVILKVAEMHEAYPVKDALVNDCRAGTLEILEILHKHGIIIKPTLWEGDGR